MNQNNFDKLRRLLITLLIIRQIKVISPQSPQDDLNSNMDHISHNIYVSHYDCSLPQNTQMYSLSEVTECETEDPQYERANVFLNLFQRNPLYKITAWALKVDISHTRYWCGMHSHSSMSRSTNMITRSIKIEGKLLKEIIEANKEGTEWEYIDQETDYDLPIPFILDTKKVSMFTKG